MKESVYKDLFKNSVSQINSFFLQSIQHHLL